MNIVQIHERIRFWLDIVGSSRFEASDIDVAMNTSQHDMVEERYEASKKMGTGDSFQKTQKLRDELKTLVVYNDTDTDLVLSSSSHIPAGDTTRHALITAASFPEDYKYLLCVAFRDDSTAKAKYNCWPLTYNRQNLLNRNPFRRVRYAPFSKQYFIESNEGIMIYHALPSSLDISRIEIFYLKEPIFWHYGIEKTLADTLVVASVVIVVSETAVYNGTTYLRGDEITIVAGHTNITSGTVLDNYTTSDITSVLHEDIARNSAIDLLISIRDFDKVKMLKEMFD
jgi:hypothetical protein